MDLIIMKLKDIKGNSTVKGFEDGIELMSYSHGVSAQVTGDFSAKERVSGKPHHQDFNVTKYLDIASPSLNLKCCEGKSLGEVVITVGRNAEGKVEPLIIYTLSNAVISSISIGGGGGDKPVETLSLNYSKIKWDYKQQKTDAKVAGQLAASWDLATNTTG